MELKKIIFENEKFRISNNILEKILNEKDPSKQLIMAKLNLRELGSGAGRSVFDLGNQTVLKIRSNSIFSSSQNKTESSNWNCVKSMSIRDFFVQVFEVADNYSWIISEKVTPLTKKDYQFVYSKIIQMISDTTEPLIEDLELNETFFTIYDIFAAAKNKQWPFPNSKSSWFEDLSDALNSCNINYFDFTPNNFGLNSEGNLVILDYGV